MSAEEVLNLIKSSRDPENNYAFLDVRSEGEFEEGALPVFINIPILSNKERHEVGVAYKQMGQDAAVKLGFELVMPERVNRENQWLSQIEKSREKTAIITCWRGGMRSELACEWIKRRGGKTLRVVGGYKEIRRSLLATLDKLPELVILSGLTGSGKTRLLKKIQMRLIDLEALAHHRGSTFGRMFGKPQPSQATFENRILFDLWNSESPVVLEDESARIGRLTIPKKIKEKMNVSQVILLETPLEKRAEWIFEEYVLEPAKNGFSHEENHEALVRSLEYLRDRLGDQRFREIKGVLDCALNVQAKAGWLSFENHRNWIKRLLVEYYDPLYQYAFNRLARKIIFTGNEEECFQWMQKKYGSQKQ